MIKTVLAAVALAAVSSAALAQTAPAQDHSAHPGHETHAAAARPTIARPIKDLLADPQTAAVLEKHMPGISRHPALPQFQDFTLAQVAPMSGGAVTPAIIAAVDADLKALPAPAAHAH